MLNPNEKCAVFLDIDGTLISGSLEIPEGNQRAIAAAREKGHMVFINTGRSWGNIPETLLSQFNVDGIIAGSGVMITMNGKTVYRASMGNELVRRIAEYAFNHREYWYIFEGLNRVYFLPNDVRDPASYQVLLAKPEDVQKMFDGDEIQVIAMGVKVPDEFKEHFKDEIEVFQFDTYADCVIKGTNKATGIQKVLELTGIKRENTIAVGDSNNDMDMIKFAGVGVAMANAQQSILDVADYVTESAEKCGVAAAIEKFLL